MLKRLPDFVEPLKLADEEKGFSGSIPLSDMPRLQEATAGDAHGHVEIAIHFGKDDFNIRNIRGHAQCHLQVVCQRCMADMDLDLQVDIALALVSSEQEAEQARFPEVYEPLVVSAKSLKLASIIEDELLLALPVVAVHEAEDCNQILQSMRQSREPEEEGSKKPNPFSVLKGLKSDS